MARNFDTLKLTLFVTDYDELSIQRITFANIWKYAMYAFLVDVLCIIYLLSSKWSMTITLFWIVIILVEKFQAVTPTMCPGFVFEYDTSTTTTASPWMWMKKALFEPLDLEQSSTINCYLHGLLLEIYLST